MEAAAAEEASLRSFPSPIPLPDGLAGALLCPPGLTPPRGNNRAPTGERGTISHCQGPPILTSTRGSSRENPKGGREGRRRVRQTDRRSQTRRRGDSTCTVGQTLSSKAGVLPLGWVGKRDGTDDLCRELNAGLTRILCSQSVSGVEKTLVLS